MSTTIPAYRLKIERSKRHIRELTTEIQAFIAREPYRVFAEDDPRAAERVYKVEIREDVPQEWSGIVGDAIHNARSALDLLMVAIVRHCDPTRASYNHVHFVIRESRDKFETALRENTKGASPEAISVLKELKPYKGGDEAFWRLHQLDVLDKHKALIPVGAAYQAFGITFHTGMAFPDQPWAKNVPPTTVFFTPANQLFPLQNGAELLRTPLGENIPFKDDHQFRVHIAFGEGQIIDGEPIVPALTQFCDFVDGVIEIVENRILSIPRRS